MSFYVLLLNKRVLKAYYEPSGDEKASKSVPDINKDENISAVDLHTHFYRQDIADWCDAHGLISHGSKKELVERYRRFVDGKLEDRDSKKERSSKKKQSVETEAKHSDQEGKPSNKRKSSKDKLRKRV